MNGHEPSVVLFCRSNTTTSSASTHWKADHGGPTWQSQHIPLILSGPGIRAGRTISAPAQLSDVAPTVLAAMGVRPAGMEGRVLTDALADPAPRDRRARDAEVHRLRPVIRA